MKTRTPEQKVAWEEIVKRTSFEGWDFDEKNVEIVQDLYRSIDPVNAKQPKKKYQIRALSQDKQRQVIKLYKNGTTSDELAEQFNVSRTTIYEVLKGVGSPARRKNDKERERRNTVILSLKQEGYEQKRIGELVGVSAATVGKVVRGVK